jgi:Bacteriocin-protection, YdeI or OmpD-Associated/Domain of unknown function (DUF1905)
MHASKICIRSQIKIIGVNPYVLIGAKEVSRLKKDWRKPMPVRFWTDGMPWRVNLMPVGDGTFRLYLNGEIRKATNLTVGNILTAEVQFDAEYRNGPMHPMPLWFRKKLNKSSLARRTWDQLSPSRQKEILRYFYRLKSDDARQRNMQRAVYVLSGGRGRFIGKSWNE